jgi:hypothetical protein
MKKKEKISMKVLPTSVEVAAEVTHRTGCSLSMDASNAFPWQTQTQSED